MSPILCVSELTPFRQDSLAPLPISPLAGERLQPLGHLSFVSAVSYLWTTLENLSHRLCDIHLSMY